MGPSVTYTVVFLWFSASGAATTPLPPELDDLYDYGAARGVSFVPPSRGPLGPQQAQLARPMGLPRYDAALVDRLETELEQARTSLSALEEAAAKERLARIEAELLAHPHLPQAAFLMAECLALKAQASGAGAAALEL